MQQQKVHYDSKMKQLVQNSNCNFLSVNNAKQIFLAMVFSPDLSVMI